MSGRKLRKQKNGLHVKINLFHLLFTNLRARIAAETIDHIK